MDHNTNMSKLSQINCSNLYISKSCAESFYHTFYFSDPVYLQFFGDDFLRLILLRYVFCDVVLHLHRSFKVDNSN